MFTLGSELPVLQILAVTTFEAKTSNELHHLPPRVGFFIAFLELWSTSQHRFIAVTASLLAFAFMAPMPEDAQLVWFRFANTEAIVSYVFKCLLQSIHALRRRPLPVFCLLLQAYEWLY